MSGVVLALDIATATGWAHDGPTPGVPVAGTFRAPRPFGDQRAGFEYGRTFLAFTQFVIATLNHVKPDIVAFEAPIQSSRGGKVIIERSHYAERILFGLAAIAEAQIERFGVRAYEVNVQEAKKYFVRRGAQKSEMVARCKQLGWDVVDDNAADACAIWSLIKTINDPKWSPVATPLFARL